jgi:hypothetical protein
MYSIVADSMMRRGRRSIEIDIRTEWEQKTFKAERGHCWPRPHKHFKNNKFFISKNCNLE